MSQQGHGSQFDEFIQRELGDVPAQAYRRELHYLYETILDEHERVLVVALASRGILAVSSRRLVYVSPSVFRRRLSAAVVDYGAIASVHWEPFLLGAKVILDVREGNRRRTIVYELYRDESREAPRLVDAILQFTLRSSPSQ